MVKSSTHTPSFTVLAVGKYNNSLKDLSNLDAFIFRDFLLNKNYIPQREVFDENVTATDFIQAGAESDILYFTGHGLITGDIGLFDFDLRKPSNSNSYRVNWMTIKSTWVKLKYVFLMCCDVLYRKEWGQVLAEGTHHIFGYTGSSDDSKDNRVIHSFLCWSFGESSQQKFIPRTMLDAWLYSNILWEEQNCAIIGHSKNINDFIFHEGSGPTLNVLGDNDIYRWYFGKNEIRIADDNESNDSSIKYSTIKLQKENWSPKELKSIYRFAQEHFSCYQVKDNCNLFIYPSGAMVYDRYCLREPYKYSRTEAFNTAKSFINNAGGFPLDARLVKIVPHLAEKLSSQYPLITGYLFEFKHYFDHGQICGGCGESIKVLVDNDGVAFYFRYWREIVSAEPLKSFVLIKLHEAINRALEIYQLDTKLKIAPEINQTKLVYWSAPFYLNQQELFPAWQITISNKMYVYINAQTGDYLGKSFF